MMNDNPALTRFIGEMLSMGVTDEDELARSCEQFLQVQTVLPTVLAEMN